MLRIAPNPVDEMLSLEVTSPLDEITALTIFDGYGQVMSSVQIKNRFDFMASMLQESTSGEYSI